MYADQPQRAVIDSSVVGYTGISALQLYPDVTLITGLYIALAAPLSQA